MLRWLNEKRSKTLKKFVLIIKSTPLTSGSPFTAVYYFCNTKTFSGNEYEEEIRVDICRRGKVDTPGCIGKNTENLHLQYFPVKT